MNVIAKGTKSRRVLFVIGSGVSLKSGAPDVKEITTRILSASLKEIPQCYQFGVREEELGLIQNFLNILTCEYKRQQKEANYEDLFSLCLKLYEHETGISNDVSIIRLRDHIYNESAHLWKSHKNINNQGKPPLAALADKAIFMIGDCLKTILSSFHKPQGLNLITETINVFGARSVDVITLNHDRLLEYHLDENNVKYTCGFDPMINRDGEVDFFDESAFANCSQVRIIKLHGSCEWLRLGKEVSENTTLWRWGLANETADWHGHLEDGDGNKLIDDPFDRSILTGSTTKTTAYTRGIFGDLYIEARKLMHEYDAIVCSGYGWKDDGFNLMIKEWAQNKVDRKLLLLHDLEKDDFKAKPWVWPNGWSCNNQIGWLSWHPNWLCNTSLKDIENKIF